MDNDERDAYSSGRSSGHFDYHGASYAEQRAYRIGKEEKEKAESTRSAEAPRQVYTSTPVQPAYYELERKSAPVGSPRTASIRQPERASSKCRVIMKDETIFTILCKTTDKCFKYFVWVYWLAAAWTIYYLCSTPTMRHLTTKDIHELAFLGGLVLTGRLFLFLLHRSIQKKRGEVWVIDKLGICRRAEWPATAQGISLDSLRRDHRTASSIFFDESPWVEREDLTTKPNKIISFITYVALTIAVYYVFR